MSNVDELFRGSYHADRPASPPAGQWDRIARGKSALDPKYTLGMVLAGLVGLSLMIGLGFLAFSADNSDAGSLAVASESTHAPDKARTSPNPESYQSHASVYADTGLDYSVTTSNVEVPTNNTPQLPERLTPPPKVMSTAPSASAMHPRAAAPSREWKPYTEALQRKPSTSMRIKPVASLPTMAFTPAEQKLATYTVPRMAPPTVAREQLRRPRTPGYWEANARVGMRWGIEWTMVSLYDITGPATSTNSFRLPDGERVSVRRRGRFNDASARTFHWGLAGLGAARQFGNGIRIGLELLREAERTNLYIDSDPLMNGIPSDFAIYTSNWREFWNANLSLGYTFRRSHRWQFYVGALALGRFSSSGNDRERFYEFATERVTNRGGRNPLFNRSFLHHLRILPQAGVFYQPNGRWRVGLITGPGLGLSTGYRW